MACVRWSSESRTTRALPPSNTNCYAEMTFGSALEFSHSALKRNGDLRKAPQVKLAKGSAKRGLHGRRTARSATPRNASRNQRFAFVACSPRSRPRHGKASHDRARLPRVASQPCPLTVYAGVVGQGPSVWQGSNAPWRNPARPSDNRAGGPISRGIRPVTNCIESADAASTT